MVMEIRASTRPQLFAADHARFARRSAASSRCFNEAAAIRCGSLSYWINWTALDRASTRPQLFAADHYAGMARSRARRRASTRPQLFAADHQLRSYLSGVTGLASTRPQLFAADHAARSARSTPRINAASTRPQLFAADHCTTCGGLHLRRLLQRGRSYSLRITRSPSRCSAIVIGLQRGRSYSLRITQRWRQSRESAARSFNEAAAIRCGSQAEADYGKPLPE